MYLSHKNPLLIYLFCIMLLTVPLIFSAAACGLPFFAQNQASPTASALSPIASKTALQTATETVSPSPTNTIQPTSTITSTSTPVPALLPAPLYFISDRSGQKQIWRIEMNGGFAHPITQAEKGIVGFDISPVDGRLAYVSDNNLYVSLPDGSQVQTMVTGEPIKQDGSDSALKAISAPCWSPDGKKLAYALDGVNILDLSSAESVSLITNHIPKDQIGADWQVYFPLVWSQDGQYIATMVGYYEGAGFVILPSAGGKPIDPQLNTLGDIILSADPDSFYLASSAMAFGTPGFWQIRWDNGQYTQLSPQTAENQEIPLYAYPVLATDGRVYFFYGNYNTPVIASANPDSIGNMNVLNQLDYFPGSALWAADASLVVVSGKHPGDPLEVVFPGKGSQALEINGDSMKWGIKTKADVLLAGTPVPTLTPTVTLPAPSGSSKVITKDNVTTLQVLTQMDASEQVYGLAISPDGRLLALGLQGSIHLWDLSTMKQVAKLGPYSGIIPGLDFSPDSRYLAAGTWDKVVDIWDVTTQQKVKSFNDHTDFVEAVRFSPDGKLLASVAMDNRLIIWNVASGSVKRITELGGWGEDVAFSPYGKLMAVATWDKDVAVYQVDTGDLVDSIRTQPDQWALSLNFSPDGSLLVYGSWDKRVVMWSLGEHKALFELLGHTDHIRVIKFSPDGSILATAAEDGELRLWDVAKGIQLHQVTGDRLVVFSPDGRLLFTPGFNLYGVMVYYVP